MATGKMPLTQLQRINNLKLDGALASEIADAAPALAAFNSRVASQLTDHHWLVYTDPMPADFRALNDGRDEGHSLDRDEHVALEIMDASFSVDAAAGDGYPGGIAGLLQREGTRALRQCWYKTGVQCFYGTTAPGSAGGFLGLLQATDGTTPYYDSISREMVVNGGGASVGEQSSVWLLRTDFDNISVVTGNGGNITMGESTRQRVHATANSKPLSAYHTPIHAWYGLQWGSKYSACRIANVETTLTDDMIAAAIAKFPVGYSPNLIVMSRRSGELLRSSRTSVNSTGAPAPPVENVFGLDIVVTDEIMDTEAVVA